MPKQTFGSMGITLQACRNISSSVVLQSFNGGVGFTLARVGTSWTSTQVVAECTLEGVPRRARADFSTCVQVDRNTRV